MESQAIENVLNSFQPNPWGWQCGLPEGTDFFGKRVELHVTTRLVPDEGVAPSIESNEAELARLILSALPAVIAEAERRFDERMGAFPDRIGGIDRPHIWINRETLSVNGEGFWTFAVGLLDGPDHGVHIEFNRLEFQQVWAGD